MGSRAQKGISASVMGGPLATSTRSRLCVMPLPLSPTRKSALPWSWGGSKVCPGLARPARSLTATSGAP